MRTVKTDNTAGLRKQALNLGEFARTRAAADKGYEATKTVIAVWLRDNRGIDIDALPVGETVVVQEDGQDILRITIGAQHKVDLAILETKFAAIVPEVKRDFPTRTYKSLV